MAEYIERESLLEEVRKDIMGGLNARCIIERFPAADVRPVVRGKWVPNYVEYDYDESTPLTEPLKLQDGWRCSLCGWYMPIEANFCHNCGAKMMKGV